MVGKLVSELYAKKCVLVPFSLVAAFMLECMQQGITAQGGAFEMHHYDIEGQYFYI